NRAREIDRCVAAGAGTAGAGAARRARLGRARACAATACARKRRPDDGRLACGEDEREAAEAPRVDAGKGYARSLCLHRTTIRPSYLIESTPTSDKGRCLPSENRRLRVINGRSRR